MPERETVVLDGALSVGVKEAVRDVPGLGGVLGVNVTVMVQFPPFAATVLPHVLLAE